MNSNNKTVSASKQINKLYYSTENLQQNSVKIFNIYIYIKEKRLIIDGFYDIIVLV